MGRTLIGIAATTAVLLPLGGCRQEPDINRTIADYPGEGGAAAPSVSNAAAAPGERFVIP